MAGFSGFKSTIRAFLARRAAHRVRSGCERSLRHLPAVLGTCALIRVTLATGCSKETPTEQRNARDAGQSAAQSERLKAAKRAAVTVLADVEACEMAVLSGTSIGELSQKASRARASTQAFARSENGKLLPKVASALSLAAQGYVDSCAVWSADEKAAREYWLTIGNARGKTLDECRNPDRYVAVWAKAGKDLGKVRLALRSATL